MANGTLSLLLMYLVALSTRSHVGTMTPTYLQQFLANEHLKNMCLMYMTLDTCSSSSGGLLCLADCCAITKKRPCASTDMMKPITI
jgi:hypothetical protein